jgi:hypothetical protein
MGKQGMGTGSALLILIFAVLCLTIFALISLSSAGNDKALADANAELVMLYYEADALAETILAEIIASLPGTAAGEIRGVPVTMAFDEYKLADVISYRVPVNEYKSLHVEAVFGIDGVEVLCWAMRDARDWKEEDEPLNVWDGN